MNPMIPELVLRVTGDGQATLHLPGSIEIEPGMARSLAAAICEALPRARLVVHERDGSTNSYEYGAGAAGSGEPQTDGAN